MILLDTCAIIWDALQPDKLTEKARQVIQSTDKELMICDISIWEISMLIKKRRLKVNVPSAEFIKLLIQAKNYRIQDITPEIAELSVNFGEDINNDPADRLIAATSVLMNTPIITADKNLRGASILETIW